MTRVYWDTMLFIYLLENRSAETDRVAAILSAMQKRGDRLSTSTFTLGELLVKPYRTGNVEAAERIKSMLAPPRLELIPLSATASDRYARIRASYRVSPSDAIHLAAASSLGTTVFLTNDRALTQLRVDGIEFIVPLDTNLF